MTQVEHMEKLPLESLESLESSKLKKEELSRFCYSRIPDSWHTQTTSFPASHPMDSGTSGGSGLVLLSCEADGLQHAVGGVH